MNKIFLAVTVLVCGNFALAADYIDAKDCKMDQSEEWFAESAIIKGSQLEGIKAAEEIRKDRKNTFPLKDQFGFVRGEQLVRFDTNETITRDPSNSCSDFWTFQIIRRCSMGELSENAYCRSICERTHDAPDCR